MEHEQTDWRELIERDAATVHGQPRVKGTRIPVTVVLDCLASSMSPEEIIDQYPTLNPDSIRACVGFAADVVRENYGPSVRAR